MRQEFDEVEAEFATPRVSELAAAAEGIEDEDLIEREDMVVTVTIAGYIKRTTLSHIPRAEARRQGPRRAWHQGRGCGYQPVRHLDAPSGAVLFQPRSGLPHEGVALARRRSRTPRAGR